MTKRKAPKKPRLEWKLAYVENGKRRLALTEEEDRELDAIIESHRKNLNYIAGSLESMKTRLTALSQHRNTWPREIAKELLPILERVDQNFSDGYSVVSDLVFLDGS
jgi:Na+/phosphate symporter